MTRKAVPNSTRELRAALIVCIAALLASACIVHTPYGTYSCTVTDRVPSCVPAHIELPKGIRP